MIDLIETIPQMDLVTQDIEHLVEELCTYHTIYPYSATSKGTLKLPSVQRRCAIADPSPSSCHHRECDALG